MRRRDFLRYSGKAFGAMFLVSCGGGGGGSDIPGQDFTTGSTAYQFFRLINTDDTLASGRTLAYLPGHVAINDKGEVLFQAEDSSGQVALHSMNFRDQLSFQTVAARTIIIAAVGEQTTDGCVIRQICPANLNNLGTCVVPLLVTDPSGGAIPGYKAIYVGNQSAGQLPELFAKAYQEFDDEQNFLGGQLGDVDIDSGQDRIIFVSSLGNLETGSMQKALLAAPQVDLNQRKVILTTDNLVPDSFDAVGDFGIIVVKDGFFTGQVASQTQGNNIDQTGGDEGTTTTTTTTTDTGGQTGDGGQTGADGGQGGPGGQTGTDGGQGGPGGQTDNGGLGPGGNSQGNPIPRVAQQTGGHGSVPPQDDAQGAFSANFSGKLDSPTSSLRLRSHPAGIRARGVLAQAAPTGASFFGPRIDSFGQVVQVLHSGDEVVNLYRGSQRLLGFGDRIGAKPIVGMSPPVTGPDGRLYLTTLHEDYEALLVLESTGFNEIIRTGESVQGKVIDEFMFGLMPTQVNASGEIAFAAEFEDGNQAIVIGFPI